MPGALDGVRVLDLTHVLNGPFCTVLLAHMGAEVLKIEYGEGDRFRHAWMPMDVARDGYEFIAVNANKKGLVLNLKKPEGVALFIELMKRSDVVVENFTSGTMERLGLGYETLREINPRLIYACSRGFGETGPYKDVRANAATISGISGWSHESMRLADRPGARSILMGDETAGVSMCTGILAALYRREKTGRGQKIEVSMQEAILGFMVGLLHTHFEGVEVGPAPKKCADGYYAFHVRDITDRLWRELVTSLGRPALASDERFLTPADRRRNYPLVEATLTELVADRTRAELWDIMCALGMSSAPVLSVEESVGDPHLNERDAFVEVEHPAAGKVRLLAPWVRFSETPSAITAPSPLMGQHTREILADVLGLSDLEINALERSEVVTSVHEPTTSDDADRQSSRRHA